MPELNNSNNQQLPPDATPVSTDDLLMCIGELFVQVRVLRKMISQRLESNDSDAIKERSLSSN
jgi:hypothetical protein